MSVHASTETLSAYVDRELPAGEAERLETHLEDCPRCRAELAGLRRVVGRLERLEQVAPPPLLARNVTRRIALEERPRSLVERLESRFTRLDLDNPIFFTFALVLALATIVYLFAWNVDRHERRRIPVLVATGFEADAGPDFAAPPATAPILDGRRFERRGEVWVEAGIGESGEVEEGAVPVLEPDEPEARALLADRPELAAALSGALGEGERVRVLGADGEVVELRVAGGELGDGESLPVAASGGERE